MVGKQTLEVMLHEGVEHSHDGGDSAERKHDHAPPPCRLAGEIEHDADEAVDGDLGHHAAHQRGDVARRRWVRSGSHTCSGTRPALEPAPINASPRMAAVRRGRMLGTTDLGKGVAAIRTRQQAEHEQQSERAEAGHDQVDISRAGVLADAVMCHDERPGRQRHELPRHEKSECVVGQHDDRHPGEKCRVERQNSTRSGLVASISERKQACRRQLRD